MGWKGREAGNPVCGGRPEHVAQGPPQPLEGRTRLPFLGRAHQPELPQAATRGHQRPQNTQERWVPKGCASFALLPTQGFSSSLAGWVTGWLPWELRAVVGLRAWVEWTILSEPIFCALGPSQACPADVHRIPWRGPWVGSTAGSASPRAFYLCAGQRVLVHKSLDKLLRPDVSQLLLH